MLGHLLRATAGLRWMGGAASVEAMPVLFNGTWMLLEAEGYTVEVIDRNPNTLYTIVARPRTL
jgi:hypothetical protein